MNAKNDMDETVATFLSGMHPRVGEISPVNGTPMELMEGIVRLAVGPRLPKFILVTTDHNQGVGVGAIDIDEERIGPWQRQMMSDISFDLTGHCLNKIEGGARVLLIGGVFSMPAPLLPPARVRIVLLYHF